MALLSVVLPIHNVEEYLQPALDSLATQTHRDIEVVMVDDGSTDDSSAIAAGYQRSDPRFTLVRQENGGLGNARNTGVRHATGDLLMFVDSDDVIPHYAFKTIVSTLEQTGSDFVTGKVSRIDARGAFPAPMHKEAFTHSELQTNVTERPALMRDLLACNKVYRRDFWDTAGLEFVEGILYEDGPTSVRAHACAKSVDVIAVPIYYWRLRDGVTRSLSQQSEDKRFFVDRIYASRVSADFLRERRADLLPAFYAMDVKHKFDIMYKALPLANTENQQLFMQAAVPYLAGMPSKVIEDLPPSLQERVQLTREGSLDDLLAHLRPPPKDTTVTLSPAARAKTVLRRSHALRTVNAYLRRPASTSKVRSAVTGMELTGQRLTIHGYSYVVGLPAEGRLTAANRIFWARHERTRRRARLSARSHPSPLATASALESSWSYRRSGFTATLDLRGLRDQSGEWGYGTWVIAMGAVTLRGLHRGGLRIGPDANRMDVEPFQVDAGTRLLPYFEDGVMKLSLERIGAELAECRLVGSDLVIEGRAAAAGSAHLQLCRVEGVAELSVPVEVDKSSRFTATVPIAAAVSAFAPVAVPPVAGVQDRLQLEMAAGEARCRVTCAPEFSGVAAFHAGHHLALHPEADAGAVVTIRPTLPVVEDAAWDGAGALRISGSGAREAGEQLVVCRHTARKEERAYPVEVAPSGQWSVRIDPERAPHGGGYGGLRAGLWRLVLRARDAAGRSTDTDLPYLPRVFDGSEGHRIEFAERYRLERIGVDALAVRVHPRLRPEERGMYHSRQLRESFYPTARVELPLRDAVLYDSFTGKQFSDSPRAVYEELLARGEDLEHVWVTRDGEAPVPPSTRTVERNSRAFFEALATARYVVANTHLPPWFQRREGQVVAQTWHGIGFKRVGFDIEAVQFANKAYLANLLREAPNWSFLVSPNAFCTPILRRAFRYEGEICEIGSPRNDLLIAGDRAAITQQVRAAAGLPADKKIILYAPTWRDNEYHAAGQYKFNLRLDVSKLPPQIKDEYVLLVRRHPNTVDDLLGRGSDFVWDVANYPDTRDLLAAADVLITDYSTIALDFANTGRPMLFYTYDLASYRDDLRGFYFDLESEAPGPVVETTAEVAAALCDLPSMIEQYRERYDAFRRIFCHAEDGRATDRLVERLLRDRARP
jgi:CDP-glycerol glycerophosphotransferase